MMGPFPTHDMHVHSTFSDGQATIGENVVRAIALGLDELTLVDHVRVGTDWVPQFVGAVNELRGRLPLRLSIGVEAKILSVDGSLDLPEILDGIDHVYIADHQVPGPDGPLHPNDVREAIATGAVEASQVVEWIVDGTVNAMLGRRGSVLAHLFSVLPKIGLDEGAVSDDQIRWLASTARHTDTTIEVSERWRCPGARTVAAFAEAGARIVVSTDSHALDTLGRYTWCRTTWEQAEHLLAHPNGRSVHRAAMI
jgi:putative hydrolase